MNSAMRVCVASGLAAVAASTLPAAAGFRSAEARLDGDLMADSNVSGLGELHDDRFVGGVLRYMDTSDDGMPATDPTAGESTFDVDSRLGDFGGYGTQIVRVDLGSTLARVETDILGGAAGSFDPFDATGLFEAEGSFHMDLQVREETLVEFTLRLELVPGASADDEPAFNANGRVELQGADGEVIEIDDRNPGVVTFTTTQLIINRASLEAFWDLQIDSGDGLESADLFRLTAEARIVPAPGAAGLLALAGLACARRRRS